MGSGLLSNQQGQNQNSYIPPMPQDLLGGGGGSSQLNPGDLNQIGNSIPPPNMNPPGLPGLSRISEPNRQQPHHQHLPNVQPLNPSDRITPLSIKQEPKSH